MQAQDWQPLFDEASRLHGAGRTLDAIAAYQRLLAVNPALPDSWFNLGWLQRQVRDYEAALASYGRALDAGVARPEEVHLNRAAIYSEHLRRPAETEAELLAALDKRPDYVPALLNLGNLREDVGAREGAREAYAQVLGLEPDHPIALARLATSSLAPELDEALAARLRTAIARGHASGGQPAGLGFALAALLDAAGEYDDAFAAATSANAASRAAGGAAALYNPDARESLVDRLIASFAERPVADGSPSPVFICGLYRSGSTLVEQILAGHSQISAAGELDLVPSIAAQLAGYPEAVAQLDGPQVRQLRERYLQALPNAPGPGRIVTDKRPDNFQHLGLIKTLFPGARIIHTVRDPLDNLLSLYFLHLDPRMAYALDLDDAAHWYREYRRLMAHWQALYGADMLTVDYDRLVREPRAAVGEILQFLGLPWEDACMEFHRSDQMVRTASVWQVREPLYQRSSGRWRNYARQLERVRQALAK